jgi:predicted dehydrogenase
MRGAETVIRTALLGAGSRGIAMLRHSLTLPGVRFTAVCDIDESRATRAQKIVEDATGRRPESYTRGSEDWKRMVDSGGVDAVLIMTPQQQHGLQAVYAMKAGKHVASETPPIYTIEEAWELVETKEKTGRRYMLLENYPYARTRMMILNMAHRGAFGDVTYGEASYIHDTRNLAYEKDGSLSWRGRIAKTVRGDVYPTHALGPVSLWMGIHRGDCFASLTSVDSDTRGLQSYAREHFGTSHPAAQPGFFSKRDCTITLLKSVNGKLAILRYDSGSPRPAMGWESLQGTKGSYDGSPSAELIYLEGRSPPDKWEPLDQYRAEYEHPFWKQHGSDAAKTGHGGGDFFVMREFFRALAEDREPPIDVYDAATWGSVISLSAKSIAERKTVEIPDYTRGKWKERRFTGFGIQEKPL